MFIASDCSREGIKKKRRIAAVGSMFMVVFGGVSFKPSIVVLWTKTFRGDVRCGDG